MVIELTLCKRCKGIGYCLNLCAKSRITGDTQEDKQDAQNAHFLGHVSQQNDPRSLEVPETKKEKK